MERYRMKIEAVSDGGYLLTRTVDGSSSSIKMPLTVSDAEVLRTVLQNNMTGKVIGGGAEIYGTVKEGQ